MATAIKPEPTKSVSEIEAMTGQISAYYNDTVLKRISETAIAVRGNLRVKPGDLDRFFDVMHANHFPAPGSEKLFMQVTGAQARVLAEALHAKNIRSFNPKDEAFKNAIGAMTRDELNALHQKMHKAGEDAVAKVTHVEVGGEAVAIGSEKAQDALKNLEYVTGQFGGLLKGSVLEDTWREKNVSATINNIKEALPNNVLPAPNKVGPAAPAVPAENQQGLLVPMAPGFFLPGGARSSFL